jgi:glycosyltransferase involved in cell wall biosynthesis
MPAGFIATGAVMRFSRDRSPVLLYILHCGNLYGTERMALATLEGLGEYGRRVVVAPPPGSGASVSEAAARAGYETVVFDRRLGLLKSLLPWFLRHRSIDVIGTGVVHTMACHLLGKVFGVKVRQLHVSHGGTPSALDRKQALNRLPVVMVAVSDFVRAQLIERGVRAEAIDVISNFLSEAQCRQEPKRPAYDPALRAARPVDPARVRVAIVSRVDAIKRVDVLVEAVERHGLEGFTFDIYGAGQDSNALRQRAARLVNVHFHGFVSDIHERLADADFLLHLCPEEPFGLVVLEAFLGAVVAIVPDTGGAGDLVEDGANGLRFRANDVDDLVRVLRAAALRPGRELQRMADAGGAALGTRYAQSEGVQRYRRAFEHAGTITRH